MAISSKNSMDRGNWQATVSPWGRKRGRHKLVTKQQCMYTDICVCVCVHQYIHTQRLIYIYTHIYDSSCVLNSKDYSLKQVRHFHNSFKRLLFKNGNSLEQMTGNHSSLQLTWRSCLILGNLDILLVIQHKNGSDSICSSHFGNLKGHTEFYFNGNCKLMQKM